MLPRMARRSGTTGDMQLAQGQASHDEALQDFNGEAFTRSCGKGQLQMCARLLKDDNRSRPMDGSATEVQCMQNQKTLFIVHLPFTTR